MDTDRGLHPQSPKIAIFFMPFGIVEYPHLGTGLLKACLQQHGFHCDLFYYSIEFAQRIGWDVYSFLEGNASPVLMGERVFARALSDNIPDLEDYFHDILKPALRGVDNGFVFNRDVYLDRLKLLHTIEDGIPDWLDELSERPDLSRYQVFGFSTSYEQNVASLALAKRLRRRFPGRPIIFGGANCMADMGVGLLRNFDFIDYVATGESERVLVGFLRWLADPDANPFPSKGLLSREQVLAGVTDVESDVVLDLNTLPMPDYDDYFTALHQEDGWKRHFFALVVEGSRGCWKAKKEQCLFCGLNGSHNAYRYKNADRFIEELDYLCQRYHAKYLMASDNILSPVLFSKAIPKLADRRPFEAMWQEVKVGLSYRQLDVLRRSGIRYLGAGIESLSTPLLRLMRKGSTALKNIHFLRMATELGMEVVWHVISGLPGEKPENYDDMAILMTKLVHLIPPKQIVRISIDRHSPLYLEAESFGLELEPSRAYRYIYELGIDRIAEFAYCFQDQHEFGECISVMGPPLYTGKAQRALNAWVREAVRSRLGFTDDGTCLAVHDQRYDRNITRDYRGLSREVIGVLKEPRSMDEVTRRIFGSQATSEQISSVESELADLVDADFVLEEEGQYLFIAIDYAIRERCLAEHTDNFFLKALRTNRPYSFDG